jgi:L-iditol 2-dehydrogenase
VTTERVGDVPRTMRISVLSRPGRLELQERAVPRPGPQDVLVAVRSVGICGSDAHYFQHGRIADFVVRGPLVLGHESSGRIVAVGDGVDRERLGARVGIEPGTACRACAQCKAGRYNLCQKMKFFATPPVDGALAEYVLVPADLAFDLPDEISDDAGALLEPLSVAIWATGKAAITAGDSVLIAGAGPIGLIATQVARARGATTIVVTDIAPARLAVARRNGATATLAAREDLDAPEDLNASQDFDAFLDCSGVPSAITAGIRSLRPAGRAVLVGTGPDEVTLPFGLLQRLELTITGTFRYANTWPTAISLAATGAVDLDGLITDRFGLADADQAIMSTIQRSSIKSIVEPWR